jgi:hypothetical protein
MEQQYSPGDSFQVQYVWQLPDKGDVLRVFFEAEVLMVVPGAQKYLVRLDRFLAGRQESADGTIIRPRSEMALDYWQRVVGLIGRKVTVAWEVSGGPPIYLRLATLLGEHDFFTRYNKSLEALQEQLR